MNRADLRGWLAATTASRHARSVFLALALHADGGNDAWPSVATLATETGWGTTLVRQALRELEDGGDVERRMRVGLAAVYHVNPNTRPLGYLNIRPLGYDPDDPNTRPLGTPTENGSDPNTRPLGPQHPSVAEELQEGLQLRKSARELDPLDVVDPDATLSAERAAVIDAQRRVNALTAIREQRGAIIQTYRRQRHGGTMSEPTAPDEDQPTSTPPDEQPQQPQHPDQPQPQPGEDDPDRERREREDLPR